MKVKSTIQKTIVSVFALLLCGACVFLVAGCSAKDASADSDILKAEKLEGVVTEIAGSEILINASADSNSYLAGPVRVNIVEIDKDFIDSLSIGDKVIIEYPGIVGMSEPPFVAAISIEIVK